MNELHHLRIDKGTKRDYRALARRQPRTNKGMFDLIHTKEVKQKAILDALDCLRHGETTDSIAQRHNVPGSTLRAWILADDSLDGQANIARSIFLAHELTIRADEIDKALDPLTLARAREAFRAWSWIAERREARLFGQKQEVSHKVEVNIRHVEFDSSAAELLGKLRPAIEGTCVVEPADEPILP